MPPKIEKSKYKKYKLSYPIEGSKIYRTKTLENGAKKCYGEFSQVNDIPHTMIGVRDIENNREYTFRVSDNKIINETGAVRKANKKANK